MTLTLAMQLLRRFSLMNEIGPKTSPLSISLICPLRIMFIASYPLRARRAVLNEPNPRLGLMRRLTNRWSGSTILFKYLTCLVSVDLDKGSLAVN